MGVIKPPSPIFYTHARNLRKWRTIDNGRLNVNNVFEFYTTMNRKRNLQPFSTESGESDGDSDFEAPKFLKKLEEKALKSKLIVYFQSVLKRKEENFTILFFSSWACMSSKYVDKNLSYGRWSLPAFLTVFFYVLWWAACLDRANAFWAVAKSVSMFTFLIINMHRAHDLHRKKSSIPPLTVRKTCLRRHIFSEGSNLTAVKSRLDIPPVEIQFTSVLKNYCRSKYINNTP